MGVLKLFEVELTFTAVVVAESEEEAHKVADSEAYEITRDNEPSVHVGKQITHEKDLPDEWTGDCLPYSDGEAGDGETIQFYLDSAPPEVVRDTKTIDMFAEPKS